MTTLHFLAHALRTPWAMEPGAMAAYASILARAYAPRLGIRAGDHRDDTEYDDGRPMAREPKAARAGAQRATGTIALIRVFGAIVQRGADLGPCEGGTGCEDISASLDAAMADETVSQVLMQFSTPGGSVFGVDELAAKIRSLRGTKPIVGICDSMAASAGYYLASQCSELYCTPGGQAGSIGVYCAHEYVGKALENAGVSIEIIRAGKHKIEANPFEPLTDDARADMQADVDRYYGMFLSAVAKGRGCSIDQVRDGMGEGRMFGAQDALKAKMIDGVASFEQVVRKMAGASRSRAQAKAQAATAIARVA